MIFDLNLHYYYFFERNGGKRRNRAPASRLHKGSKENQKKGQKRKRKHSLSRVSHAKRRKKHRSKLFLFFLSLSLFVLEKLRRFQKTRALSFLPFSVSLSHFFYLFIIQSLLLFSLKGGEQSEGAGFSYKLAAVSTRSFPPPPHSKEKRK